MRRLASTVFTSLLVSISAHFIATLVCYCWLVFDTTNYSIDRTILFWVLYHLIALYVSFTGLRSFGYFRDTSSFRTMTYAIIFVLTHFVSFYAWSVYKEEVISQALRLPLYFDF